MAIKKTWQNQVLKPSLKEGEDFLLVDEFVWECIVGRFKCKPNEVIQRQGILANEETDECVVELYLKTLTIFPVPNTV
jgi:hypothetical protein